MLQIMTSLSNRGYGITKTPENKELISKIKSYKYLLSFDYELLILLK